ncbi:MAG: hypothetical protein OEL83_14615 [Desulforhopalus sp.]|nr:hypothetical protein [Desulforhopalus sp.]
MAEVNIFFSLGKAPKRPVMIDIFTGRGGCRGSYSGSKSYK